MKKISLILIGVMATICTSANTRTIEYPDYTPLYADGVEIRRVEFEKKQTTLYFDFSQYTGTFFQFRPSTYLVDEGGHRFPVKSCKGFKLGEWTKVGEEGVTEVSISFEALPEGTRVFDCIEGPNLGATFQFYGIREQGQNWDVFPKKEVVDNPFKESFFSIDTVYVTGRVTQSRYDRWGGIERESLSDSERSLRVQYRQSEGFGDRIYVAKDGTFSFKTIVAKPTMDIFDINGNRFYILLIPGDHLHIDIKHLNDWNQQVTFKSELGDYQRMLVNNPFVYEKELYDPRNTLSWSETGKLAAETWKPLHEKQETRLKVCRYLAGKYHFTPTELKLLQMDVLTANAFISINRMQSPLLFKSRRERDIHLKGNSENRTSLKRRFSLQEIQEDSIHLDFSFLKECPWGDPTISAAPWYEPLIRHLDGTLGYVLFHPSARGWGNSDDSLNIYAAAKELGIGEPLIGRWIASRYNNPTALAIPLNRGEELLEHFKQPHSRVLSQVALYENHNSGVRNYPVNQTAAAEVIKKLVAPYKDKKVILMPVSCYQGGLGEIDSLYQANRKEMDMETVFLPVATSKLTRKKALKEMQHDYPILKNTVYMNGEDLLLLYSTFQLGTTGFSRSHPELMILPNGTYNTSATPYLNKFSTQNDSTISVTESVKGSFKASK